MKLPNNDWKQILEQQAPDTLPTFLDVVDDKYEHEHIRIILVFRRLL